KGDYVMRLDAHSTYPADYLEQCLRTAARTRCDNVGGIFDTRARGPAYHASLVQALTTHWFGVGRSFRTTAEEGPADTVAYAFFALGMIVGLPLAVVSSTVANLMLVVMVAYGVLAILASVQQALRYRRLRHAVFLPVSFLAYHVTHGLGVLAGVARIALGTQP